MKNLLSLAALLLVNLVIGCTGQVRYHDGGKNVELSFTYDPAPIDNESN